MEIWLKLDDKNVKDFRFPVVPNDFDFETSNIINSSNITKLGEVGFYGGDNLSPLEINSFFPSKNYSFCQYSDFPKPLECVAYIKKLMKDKRIPRLIYTDTDINIPVLIESFNYGRKDGTQDIYFTLKFKEYRKIEVPEISKGTSNNSTQNNQRPTDDKSTDTQQTHTVKKGDTLWDISQKYLGKGSLYNKIKEANWNTYTSLKKNNIIYVNWKLVIPKV